MNKYFKITLIVVAALAFLILGCDPDESISGTDSRSALSGTLSTDLTMSESPYLMVGDVLIPDGQTVSIEPGVEVFVDSGLVFEVNGTLLAEGTENAFIHFTTDREPMRRGDWKGIWLIGADDASRLEYVQVSYANKYDLVEDTTRVYDDFGEGLIDTIIHRGAITIQDCSPVITRCIIDNAGYDGIQIIGFSDPDIQYNTIVASAFNGMRIEPNWPNESEYGSPIIKNNIIVENEDAGIRAPGRYDTFPVTPTIEFNDIWNNKSLDFIPETMRLIIGNNISLDPQFIDLEMMDVRLHPCSGALDQGDPEAPSDPDGTVADLGAFPLFQAPNELAHALKGDHLHLTTAYDYYLVTCDIMVEEGDVLTIDPGVEIRFAEQFALNVNGDIHANGESGNPIIFTSNSETPRRGDWLNLVLNGVSSSSNLDYVEIEYASVDDLADMNYSGALSVVNSSPTLNNVTIREAYYNGVYLQDGASPAIDRLTVEGVGLTGILLERNCNPVMQGVIVRETQGYGIQMKINSSPEISNALIYNVNVSGIVIELLCNPEMRNITVYGPDNYGIRMVDHCNPLIENSIFSFYNSTGIEASVSSLPSVSNVNLHSLFGVTADIPVDIIGEVMGDPSFVDPEGGDFHLSAGSPCIDTGTDGDDLGAFGGTYNW